MIIISDTSVVSNLIQIHQLELLKAVFGKIILPKAVEKEIMHLARFGVDLGPFKQADWITIQDPSETAIERRLLESLDKGEAAAIALGLELKADYLAIDERAGRKAAKQLGLKIIGLIGILMQAKRLAIIIEVKPLLDELRGKANFFIGEVFYQEILKELGETDSE